MLFRCCNVILKLVTLSVLVQNIVSSKFSRCQYPLPLVFMQKITLIPHQVCVLRTCLDQVRIYMSYSGKLTHDSVKRALCKTMLIKGLNLVKISLKEDTLKFLV